MRILWTCHMWVSLGENELSILNNHRNSEKSLTPGIAWQMSNVKSSRNGIQPSLWCGSITVFHCVHQAFVLYSPSWASYQIRKIAGCACAGNAGNVFPCRRFQRKPLVSDPGMHHGTCVTHVPWCMSGSLTCGDRENVPGIPGACAPAILRIWQEAHWRKQQP